MVYPPAVRVVGVWSSPSQLRVLFISAIGGYGGPVQSLLTVLRHLPEVHSLAVGPWSPKYRPLVEAAADEVLLIRRPRGGMNVARAQIEVVDHVRRHRKAIDVIHANGLTELVLAVPASAMFSLPVVVWVHQSEVPRAAKAIAPVAGRMRSVRFAAVSAFAADVATSAGFVDRSAVVVIPNPIEPQVIAGNPVAGGSALRVGYLGADRPSKGFDLLPETMDRLSGEDIRLLLFSSPPFATDHASWGRLATRFGSTVVDEGRRVDVSEAYARCDAVYIPSRQESFCRVAAEAMMNGLPVVAADLPPLRELLGNDEAGLLFPVENAEAGAAALACLARDPALRARLGQEGRLRAQAYAPQGVASALLELYRASTAGRHP